MLEKFVGRFYRGRQPDPVTTQAGRILAQHSQELLNQMRDLVENQKAQAATETSDVSEQQVGSNYANFVRSRRDSLARKLMADTRLQELREEVERVEVVRALAGRVTNPDAQATNCLPQIEKGASENVEG